MAPVGSALRFQGTTTTTSGARAADMSRVWTPRLQKELEGLWADPPEWCVPGADTTDLFHWQAIVVGPRGSPYDGGVFAVRFKFPRQYPFKPPKVTFATKVLYVLAISSGSLISFFLQFLSRFWWVHRMHARMSSLFAALY